MSSNNMITFAADTHPHLYLPEDPFPYSFDGLSATLKDFLKVVRKHPAYVESTHAAFYRLFVRDGLNTSRQEDLLRMTGEEIPAYNSCGSYFGVEEYIHQIVNGYGFQASQGGRARKKALVMTGSPGAGKSDWINMVQYDIMRRREPIPFLAGSPMWSNPLNALFLIKKIALKKTRRVMSKSIAEMEAIIDRLDLNGDAALNFDNFDFVGVASKHGFSAGEELSSADLAQVAWKSPADFVKLVCYGLDVPKASVDALVEPDPWAQDVVIGEFFGATIVKKQVLEDAGLAERFADKEAKSRRDEKYGQYDADLAVDLSEFPIDNMFMAEGQGMVDVAEVQPINFDLRVYRGDQDISAIGLYDDRDPRTVSPSGVFNTGKLIVLTEGLRNPDEAFRVLLEALEGQRVSLPEPLGNHWQQGVGWEGMVIIHSNDEQWNKFYSNPDHRAHNDRMHWVSFKYPLEPEMATKVTEKLWSGSSFGRTAEQGGVHREPLVSGWSGLFRVATHLDWESKEGLPFMAVLRAYMGEQVRQTGMGTEIDVRALREKAPWTEGLDGMSPRDMDTYLGEMASMARHEFETGKRSSPGFTVAELRDHLIKKFGKDPRVDKKQRELWVGWMQGELEKFRRIELSRVYRAAFIPDFKDLCQNYFEKYLEFIKSTNRRTPQRGPSGSQYLTSQDMEKFMQEIESADTMRINTAQADKFRQNVLVAVGAYKDEHGVANPPYTCHEGLKRCIEAYVLRQGKDITGVMGLTNLSKEEEKRLASAKQRLIDDHGYDDYTAQRLLVEVAQTRDFLTA